MLFDCTSTITVTVAIGAFSLQLPLAHCLGRAGAAQRCAEMNEAVQAEQLLEVQDRASDGVVSLDTVAFNRFAALRSRPYQLAIFVSAKHLLDKPQLKLRDLRNEWGYLAKAFAKDLAVRGKVTAYFCCSSQPNRKYRGALPCCYPTPRAS